MKKSVLLILLLMLCSSSLLTIKVTAKSESSSEGTSESTKAKEGDFYFAFFDVTAKNTIKVAIPNLILRFYGTIDSINPIDLTDVVLTRDGIKVDNGVTYSKVEHFQWGNEAVTDVYFLFKTENTEVGNYGLTGKYKGESFKVYNKIIEAPISKKPALARDLTSVAWGYYPDENGDPKSVNEIVFAFEGKQNTFYPSNLTDLKLTLDGKKIDFSYSKDVFRYYEVSGDNDGDTSYNLILMKDLTKPGTYCLTGKYRGKAFKSMEIIIPDRTSKEDSKEEIINEDDKETSTSSKKGDFYMAFLNSTKQDNRIISIPGMCVRLYGHIKSVNLSDFTNVKLVKDGVVVKNGIELVSEGEQRQYGNEDVTDFYFAFKEDNVEPGYYSLTGEYKGKAFDAGKAVIESPLNETPADSDDLLGVSWVYYTNDKYIPESIHEIVFQFERLQNQFYISDLTNLKLTRNGKKVNFELTDQVIRYYEAADKKTGFTSFHLILNDVLTQPGTYCLTGSYQGKKFTSIKVVIPE
jgi:hypothetical protein